MKRFLLPLTVFSAVFLGGLVGFLVPLPNSRVEADTILLLKHHRGRRAPCDARLAELHKQARQRHGTLKLPRCDAPSWDCRKLNIAPPVLDQQSCGSCWDFSGCETVTGAFLKAGYGPFSASYYFSPQYVLDCVSSGGCDGDDNTTVLAAARSRGLPLSTDYPPYTASVGTCQLKDASKLQEIADWGYADPSQQQGVASVQAIKNALQQYGVIGCAVAAGDDWDNYQAGQVIAGTSTDVNHDVLIIGWDDSKGKAGAWLVQNSWGSSWGDSGTCWIAYGADSIGTEAVWATVTGPTPPTPPTPPPPLAAPTITLAGSGTTLDGTYELVPKGTVTGIASLAASADKLNATITPPPAPTPAPADLESRVTHLESRMATIDSAMQKILDILTKKGDSK